MRDTRRRSTFDLDYHLRRHALGGSHDRDELFREIAPAYETPFDRSRPLWEARLYEGMSDGQSALFFKLHHAVADGVGGNAIFAAMSDWEREPGEEPDAPGLGSPPFAPVALKSPASIALYGYRDRLFIGIDADETVMPDVEAFKQMIDEAFAELAAEADIAPATNA